MRYVLRDKRSGEFYSFTGGICGDTWSLDLDRALVYQTKGAPRRSLYGLIPRGMTYDKFRKLPKKERQKLVRETFDANYEILGVHIELSGE